MGRVMDQRTVRKVGFDSLTCIRGAVLTDWVMRIEVEEQDHIKIGIGGRIGKGKKGRGIWGRPGTLSGYSVQNVFSGGTDDSNERPR